MNRPVFSGHESFQCKTHWLKRGYDFVADENNNFIDDDAVVKLGVGKNMVASIKFWMKAFGMLTGEANNLTLTPIAKYLLADDGADPYLEDLGTLWLLHFMLINEDYASIYKLTFIDYHKQYNIIEKHKLQNFIKFVCFDNNHQQSLYNENTVKRDIGVLLHNYCGSNSINIEEKNTLLLPLNLIETKEIEEMADKNRTVFAFNNAISIKVPPQIFLYALLERNSNNLSISFEELQELALIFCLTNNDLMKVITQLCKTYPSKIVFSDVAGVKELQLKEHLEKIEVLNSYFNHE